MDPDRLAGLGLPLACAFASRRTAGGEPRAEPAHAEARAPELPSISSEAEALATSLRRSLAARRPERQLSVVSFNMLLKAFDRKPYYPGVTAELRSWAWRKHRFKELLSGLGADVLCMQEVECASFADELEPFLREGGYAWVAPKDDSKGKTPGLAKCAIFFRPSRLEKVWEEHRSRVVLAAFRFAATGQLLYVVSCHLEGAPWEVATRLKQLRNSLDSIQRHQKQLKLDPAACGLVFAGDFNETEDGAVCHCLREGGIGRGFRVPTMPEEEICKDDYAHPFELSDLYGAGGGWPAAERPPTFCAPAEETCAWGMTPAFAAVDFVFYTPSALRPAAVRNPFTEEQRRATAGQGIPSEWHFSDHVPIGGVFDVLTESAGDSPCTPSVEVM